MVTVEQTGFEGRMQSEDMANQMRLLTQQGLLDGITNGGTGDSGDGTDWKGLWETIFGGG